MSKGKDFQAPRKRGFDDDGPMPYESRPRPARALRRRPGRRLWRPADGRTIRRRSTRRAAGRRRRQMVQGGQGLRIRRAGGRRGRRVPARQRPACGGPRHRSCGREIARPGRGRRQGRAGHARDRSRHGGHCRAPAKAIVRRVPRWAAAAAPRRAGSVDRGLGHRQGQMVRRRQGIRLRRQRGRRQGRVRPYLRPRPGRHFASRRRPAGRRCASSTRRRAARRFRSRSERAVPDRDCGRACQRRSSRGRLPVGLGCGCPTSVGLSPCSLRAIFAA